MEAGRVGIRRITLARQDRQARQVHRGKVEGMGMVRHRLWARRADRVVWVGRWGSTDRQGRGRGMVGIREGRDRVRGRVVGGITAEVVGDRGSMEGGISISQVSVYPFC